MTFSLALRYRITSKIKIPYSLLNQQISLGLRYRETQMIQISSLAIKHDKLIANSAIYSSHTGNWQVTRLHVSNSLENLPHFLQVISFEHHAVQNEKQ